MSWLDTIISTGGQVADTAILSNAAGSPILAPPPGSPGVYVTPNSITGTAGTGTTLLWAFAFIVVAIFAFNKL